jgi:flagellar biosynthesis protein FlhB
LWVLFFFHPFPPLFSPFNPLTLDRRERRIEVRQREGNPQIKPRVGNAVITLLYYFLLIRGVESLGQV